MVRLIPIHFFDGMMTVNSEQRKKLNKIDNHHHSSYPWWLSMIMNDVCVCDFSWLIDVKPYMRKNNPFFFLFRQRISPIDLFLFDKKIFKIFDNNKKDNHLIIIKTLYKTTITVYNGNKKGDKNPVICNLLFVCCCRWWLWWW